MHHACVASETSMQKRRAGSSRQVWTNIYIYVRNQWGNLGKDAVCVFAMFDEADSWSHMQNIASWILLLTEDHVSKLVVCFARSQPRPVRGGCEGGDPKGQ